VRVGGLHVAAVWEHHGTPRARAPFWDVRCLREVKLYDVPERKKSRWESICHARALEVVRVKPRRDRSSVNVDVKTRARYRTVNANTLLTILHQTKKSHARASRDRRQVEHPPFLEHDPEHLAQHRRAR
jgi:hypothetical protein